MPDLYAEMAALAQKAKSDNMTNEERIDLNEEFVSLREQALELNELTFHGNPLFNRQAGSINYDIKFRKNLFGKMAILYLINPKKKM